MPQKQGLNGLAGQRDPRSSSEYLREGEAGEFAGELASLALYHERLQRRKAIEEFFKQQFGISVPHGIGIPPSRIPYRAPLEMPNYDMPRVTPGEILRERRNPRLIDA